MPTVAERLDLATTALTALSRGTAEMPAKIGVHPRPGALLHAMPAWLKDGDLVGLKWVSAYPGSSVPGVPAVNALMLLNDAETGLARWIMDGSRITAVRTAAVSGVALRTLQPAHVERVAILGAGVQGRSHMEVVASLLPGVEVLVHDVHPERAQALADEAGRDYGLPASVATDARSAAAAAQVVITVARMGSHSQVMTPDWVAPATLVIAVDFATYASAALARAAQPFAVDDRDQFFAYRAGGSFDEYPDPTTTLGDLVDNPVAPASDRPALVNHLGVGLADVVFADAIARRAIELGLGQELPR